MENTETQEMYLITIDRLRKLHGNVRSIDVATERGFSKSTVHAGLKNLEVLGLINFEKGNITLTETGRQKAQVVEDKHELIVKALLLLGASEEIAEINACAMEHCMTDEVFALLRQHVAHGERMLSAKHSHHKDSDNDKLE